MTMKSTARATALVLLCFASSFVRCGESVVSVTTQGEGARVVSRALRPWREALEQLRSDLEDIRLAVNEFEGQHAALLDVLKEDKDSRRPAALARWRPELEGRMVSIEDCLPMVSRINPRTANRMRPEYSLLPLVELALQINGRVTDACRDLDVYSLVEDLVGKDRPLARLIQFAKSYTEGEDDAPPDTLQRQLETGFESSLFSARLQLEVLLDALRELDRLPPSPERVRLGTLRAQLTKSGRAAARVFATWTPLMDRLATMPSTPASRLEAMDVTQTLLPELRSKVLTPVKPLALLPGSLYRVHRRHYVLVDGEHTYALYQTREEIRAACRWLALLRGEVNATDVAALCDATHPSIGDRVSQRREKIKALYRVSRRPPGVLRRCIELSPTDNPHRRETALRALDMAQRLGPDGIAAALLTDTRPAGDEIINVLSLCAGGVVVDVTYGDESLADSGLEPSLWVLPEGGARLDLNPSGGRCAAFVPVNAQARVMLIGGHFGERPLREQCRSLPPLPAVLSIAFPLDVQPGRAGEEPSTGAKQDADGIDIDRLLEINRRGEEDEAAAEEK